MRVNREHLHMTRRKSDKSDVSYIFENKSQHAIKKKNTPMTEKNFSKLLKFIQNNNKKILLMFFKCLHVKS